MTQARAYLPLPQKYRPQRFDQLMVSCLFVPFVMMRFIVGAPFLLAQGMHCRFHLQGKRRGTVRVAHQDVHIWNAPEGRGTMETHCVQARCNEVDACGADQGRLH